MKSKSQGSRGQQEEERGAEKGRGPYRSVQSGQICGEKKKKSRRSHDCDNEKSGRMKRVEEGEQRDEQN